MSLVRGKHNRSGNLPESSIMGYLRAKGSLTINTKDGKMQNFDIAVGNLGVKG